MGKSAKVAISLPDKVFDAVEKERKVRGESRSKFFRRAAEKLLSQEHESSILKAYVRGYQKFPESAEEIEAAHRIGTAVLKEEPWR
ncbi:MAG: ribbon-helix-helix protein, CopG family [Dehalococcoidales bacterium]|nr:ribbon-helix-helix protein, CopG family [Dehalococcoidales bacterium]